MQWLIWRLLTFTYVGEENILAKIVDVSSLKVDQFKGTTNDERSAMTTHIIVFMQSSEAATCSRTSLLPIRLTSEINKSELITERDLHLGFV